LLIYAVQEEYAVDWAR